jgi:polyisoprenoid-binding protein YceI
MLDVLAFILTVSHAVAEPVRYALDAANSAVSYEVGFGQDTITGRMPIRAANVTLDFESNANSSVEVVLNGAGATASFPFAEQALKGPKVLATGRFPDLVFRSTAFQIGSTTAQVEGQVTIRGVTRPIRLDAQVYRQQGTDPGDLSRMSVHITGAVNRSDFGATGWSDMVSDRVVIRIVARLNRAG